MQLRDIRVILERVPGGWLVKAMGIEVETKILRGQQQLVNDDEIQAVVAQRLTAVQTAFADATAGRFAEHYRDAVRKTMLALHHTWGYQ